MREFTSNIREHLINGLRTEVRRNRNAAYMEEAFNVRANPEGLEPFSPIVDPFESTVAVTFPFPQLHVGEQETLLLNETSISRVDKTMAPWDFTAINILAIDGEAGNTITAGGVWHIADLKTSWYLFNGETIVAKINEPDQADRILVDRVTKINTGTHFRGRVVVGGIDPDEIWGRGWTQILEFWRQNNYILPEYEANDVGSNYVMWGSIGGGDFPLWLFDDENIHQGNVDWDDQGKYNLPPEETFVIEKLRQGQFGFMPMPFDGTVLKVMPLGNGVMVYGDEGIVYLPHRAVQADAPEYAPTFGLQNLMDTGIAARGAVGGTDQVHVFMDSSGELWRITSDLSINRLGYTEYLSPMLGNEILITYDPHNSDFYIADENISFLYSSGLTEISQQPTSLSFRDGELVGLFVDQEDAEGRLVTNIVDMNMRAMKTVTGIGVAVITDNVVSVAIDYRYNTSDNFQRTSFVQINKEGNAWIRTAGVEFRVVIHTDDYTDFEVDYIKLRWQAADLRTLRGQSEDVSLTR